MGHLFFLVYSEGKQSALAIRSNVYSFLFQTSVCLMLWGRKIIFGLKLCKWQIWFSPVFIWQIILIMMF